MKELAPQSTPGNRYRILVLAACGLLAVSWGARAASGAEVSSSGATAPQASSPYTGMEGRAIKALSEDQIAGYRAGEGMGFAMAAELNGYPGPKHVLELAEELELTPGQIEATRATFDAMHAAAVTLGERLVEAETRLDRLFARHTISNQTLEAVTSESARLQGELRAVHLRAHLEMVEILSPAQRHAYMTLRGYFGGSMPQGHHPGMHGAGKH